MSTFEEDTKFMIIGSMSEYYEDEPQDAVSLLFQLLSNNTTVDKILHKEHEHIREMNGELVTYHNISIGQINRQTTDLINKGKQIIKEVSNI